MTTCIVIFDAETTKRQQQRLRRRRWPLPSMGTPLPWFQLVLVTITLVSTRFTSSPSFSTVTAAADVTIMSPNEILEIFYDSTGGDEWTENTNWKQREAPVCTWHGVSCDENGEITEIVLDLNNLNGRVPPELWKLPKLKHLNVRSNLLTDVGFDGLRTSDPVADPRSPIELLTLSENQITSMAGVGLAKGTLQYLNLYKNQIDQKLPEELFELTQLEVFYLAFNQISGPLPSSIGRLTKLTEIYAFNNRLSGNLPSELGLLDKCQILGLGDNLWTGTIPTEINEMVNLRDIAIHNSNSGGIATPGGGIAEGGDNHNTGLTGPIPTFGDMPFLTLLYLDGNDLSGTIPSDFLRHNNNTASPVTVGLSYNNITGSLPKSLERFESLNIDLVGNSITFIPPELCDKTGWMGGLVEEYKCDAILCPSGTYNQHGRVVGDDDNDACRPCNDDHPYLGSSTCQSDPNNQKPWEVLAAFYMAMSGDKWANKGGWEVFDNLFNGETIEELKELEIDVCDGWYGILCQDGEPTRLALAGNQLFGLIPEFIFSIPWRVFDVSDNNVQMNNFDIVGSTSNHLTSLVLSNIKLISLDGIDKLSNLDQLYLDGMNIEGPLPKSLFELTHLRTLHLQHGRFTGTLPTLIGQLTGLGWLNMYGNSLSGPIPSEIGFLTALHTLDLSENKFSGTLPAELSLLVNLSMFAVHQTDGKLGGSLPAFDTFPHLKGLFLASNEFEGQIPQSFLEGIEDKSVEITISLASNNLTGTLPESLDDFDQLILDLENNQITELDPIFCQHSGWMRGEVGNLPNGTECNAILCPPGTWNPFGKEIAGQPCQSCDDGSPFYGQIRCGQSETTSREREILDRLFATTGGRYWNKTHGNWLKPGIPICRREGIICSNPNLDEGVLEVTLGGFGLRGTIPSEIWELSNARRIKFTDNAVRVNLEGIEKAKDLVVLQMSSCHMRNLNGLRMASPKIREIHFAWNQFEGSIPEDVFELHQADKLFMNNNHFSGGIPSDVGRMSNLMELWLWDNKFTGPLPSEIGLLSALSVLSVKQNELSGMIPSEIQNLELLQRLELSQQRGNQFDGSFPAFDKHPKLLTLDASGNSFSGTLPPNLLSKVDPSSKVDVNLSNNGFVGRIPDEWEWFQSLSMDLSGNQISEIPAVLCYQNGWNNGLVGLLDTCDAILCPPGTHRDGLGRQKDPIEPCEQCEGGIKSAPFFGTRECLDPKLVAEREILTTFYQNSNGTNWLQQRNWLSSKPVCIWYGVICNENGLVETLELSDNFLISSTDASSVSKVLQLPELKTLDLKGNSIILDFTEIQRDTTQLEFLRLSDNGLTSLEGISNAVKLKALHVTNNKIKKLPDELYTMDHLESLFLSFNLIAGTISSRIGQLTSLKELYIFGNLMTGRIPTQVGLMSSLTDFVVSNNFLSGTIPGELSSVGTLEQLSLYNQRGFEFLTGPIPSFSGAPNLWYFDASDNDLTGPIPDNFMINSAYLNQTVSIYLQNNEITGTVPRELNKFQFLDINLAGNAIDEIPSELCSIIGWMRGNVNKIGNCSAILCPKGTFNQFGHHSPGNPCLECPYLVDVNYLGNTHCENFESERDTLIKFFVDTGGEFWKNSTSWNTQAPICSWFGIICEDDSLQGIQGVTSIALPSNGLSGTLPSEIWTLPSLQSITLDMNEDLVVELTGIANAANSLDTLSLSYVTMTSLEGISAATNLRTISVIGNDIFGTFPTELFELANTLESVYIGYNLFYGPLPSRLAELSQLQVFDAFGNDFLSTIPTELGLMANLHTLVLSENLIYGQIPAELSSIPTLRELAVDRGYKSGPSLYGSIPAFDKVPQLVYLYLEGNQLQGSIPRNFLSSSKFARIIDLSSNLLTGSIPSELLSLEELNLEVDGNQIQSFPESICEKTDWMSGSIAQRGCDGFLCPPGTSTPIGRSTNSSMACSPCDIPEAAPFYGSRSCDGPASERGILVNLYNALGGDDWLRNDFWLTSVDICDWYGIACVAGNIVEINLRGNNLRGLPGPDLFFLSELRMLWLYSNPITFSFEHIGRATKLQDLRLDATRLHSLHGIGAASSLVTFNAEFTDVKGSFSEDILRLSNLRVLSLGNNGITGTLPKSISNLKYLVSLRLNSNSLTGPVPSFEGIHFLKHLDLSYNLLTGSISKNFLSSAPSEGSLMIRLTGNQLTGIIPEEFDRFRSVSLFLSDNKILGMPFAFCDNSGWNEGDVGDFGCDGIMCRPGSYNPIGRRVSGMDCLGCHSARYYGATSCDIPITSLAQGHSNLIGSFVLSSVMTVLLVYLSSLT